MGSLRIRQYWQRKGEGFSRHRIGRLMKNAHLIPLKAAKWHPQTTKQQAGARTALNVLNQDFQASRMNEKWVSDLTYIATAQSRLYLASLLDISSRRIALWAMDERMEASLVEKAWKMAVLHRHPPTQLLHHSNRGSQYTSEAYLKLLEEAQCVISMNRTGNCYDNAVIESLHATLKGECAYKPFTTKTEARSTIFEFFEVWHNRQRLHFSLGNLSPAEFEHSSGH